MTGNVAFVENTKKNRTNFFLPNFRNTRTQQSLTLLLWNSLSQFQLTGTYASYIPVFVSDYPHCAFLFIPNPLR